MSQLDRIIRRLRAATEIWIIRKSLQGFYGLAALGSAHPSTPMGVASIGRVN